MGYYRTDRHPERSAVQCCRLLRCSRQHILRGERWHYQSNRSPLRLLTQTSAHGASGATPGAPALNASCFGIPLLSPGALNGAIPSNDPYETNFIDHGERNIFRQSWQRRADISLVKVTQITERSSLKYTFDVFNLTNTASFDIRLTM